eukprot:SAG11_NODE_816_length_7030_cov_15.673784_5_plen_224_part_00
MVRAGGGGSESRNRRISRSSSSSNDGASAGEVQQLRAELARLKREATRSKQKLAALSAERGVASERLAQAEFELREQVRQRDSHRWPVGVSHHPLFCLRSAAVRENSRGGERSNTARGCLYIFASVHPHVFCNQVSKAGAPDAEDEDAAEEEEMRLLLRAAADARAAAESHTQGRLQEDSLRAHLAAARAPSRSSARSHHICSIICSAPAPLPLKGFERSSKN